jgi:hypothetical protein
VPSSSFTADRIVFNGWELTRDSPTLRWWFIALPDAQRIAVNEEEGTRPSPTDTRWPVYSVTSTFSMFQL